MPIHNMNFENNVFFARQVGYVDDVDARMWSNALKNYAANTDSDVVAVVDMCEVERLVPTVVKVFQSILKQGNLRGVAIVAGNLMNSRNARVLSKLTELSGVSVFSSQDEAYAFANTRLNPSFGYATSHSFQALPMPAIPPP